MVPLKCQPLASHWRRSWVAQAMRRLFRASLGGHGSPCSVSLPRTMSLSVHEYSP